MNTTASNDTAPDNDTTSDSPAPDNPAPDSPAPDNPAPNPRSGLSARPPQLCRPIDDRMLAGVAAGLARYLGADVTLVRVILAVLVFAGGAGVPLYLAGWLLIPEEGAEQSIASELIGSLENRRR